LASKAGVRWTDLRAACEAEQAAYKRKDPLGFNWFINAGNGFSGFPHVLQRILPELAPEIWGRPEENFARFGLFTDDNPKRPLPRGLGVTSTAGRPVDANDDPTGEIDFGKPGLHVVTLACGACHTGQVRTESGIKIFDGAPNTQVDVRKWREAYGLTVQHYLSSIEQIRSTAQRITAIIDSKPEGYFYPSVVASFRPTAPGNPSRNAMKFPPRTHADLPGSRQGFYYGVIGLRADAHLAPERIIHDDDQQYDQR
jgi:hypothetical protein